MIKTIQNKILILSKKYGQKVGLDLPYFVKNGFRVAFRQGVGIITGLALSIAFARIKKKSNSPWMIRQSIIMMLIFLFN